MGLENEKREADVIFSREFAQRGLQQKNWGARSAGKKKKTDKGFILKKKQHQ